LSQGIRRSQRDNTEGYVCSDQWLQGFVDGAIAAACQDRVVTLPHGGLRECLGAAGRVRFEGVGVYACLLERGKEIPNDEGPACGVLP
jgi:hypothetical protein